MFIGSAADEVEPPGFALFPVSFIPAMFEGIATFFLLVFSPGYEAEAGVLVHGKPASEYGVEVLLRFNSAVSEE